MNDLLVQDPKLVLNLTTKGGGTVNATPNKTGFLEGENVKLTANPDDGWQLIGWKLDGKLIRSSIINHTFKNDLKAEAVFGTKFSFVSANSWVNFFDPQAAQ